MKSRRKPSMRKQRTWKTIAPYAAVVGAVLVAGGTVVALNSGGAGIDAASAHFGAAQVAETQAYWSKDRLKAAVPEGNKGTTAPRQGMSAESGVPQSTAFNGTPTLGALFYHNATGDHYCTASVIDSAKKNLLITAAHCIWPSNGYRPNQDMAFVPEYNAGRMPYGIWPAKAAFVTGWWKHPGNDPDTDYGFVSVTPDGSGRQIANVTGANRLAVNRPFARRVLVDGFPSAASRPIWCATNTWKPTVDQFKSVYASQGITITARQLAWQQVFRCSGYGRGTSGSPFFEYFNHAAHTGYISAVLGGFDRGGDHVGANTSFASYFDKYTQQLHDYADAQS